MDNPGNTQKELFGITFRNPIGIMCGYDKSARHYNMLTFRNFGFVEIGPILPGPQNIKPTIRRIQASQPKPLLFANLLHSPSSHDEESIASDYSKSFSLIYDFADAFCIDSSCTSAGGSRPFHDISLLSSVLDQILNLRLCYDEYKPLIVKISPDTAESIVAEILHYCRTSGIDAVCITKGSGTAEMVARISGLTSGRFPIIAESERADNKAIADLFKKGACLVGTGFGFLSIGGIFANRKFRKISSEIAQSTENK